MWWVLQGRLGIWSWPCTTMLYLSLNLLILIIVIVKIKINYNLINIHQQKIKKNYRINYDIINSIVKY